MTNGFILVLAATLIATPGLAAATAATANNGSCDSHLQQAVEWEYTALERDQIAARHRMGGDFDVLGELNKVVVRAYDAGKLEGNIPEQIEYEDRLIYNLQTLRRLVARLKDELEPKRGLFHMPWEQPSFDKIAEDYSVFVMEEILGASLWDIAREQLDWQARLNVHGLDVEMYDFERQAVVIQGLWNQFMTEPAIAESLLQHLEVFERTTSRVYRDFCAPLIHYRQSVLSAIGIKTSNSQARAVPGRFTTWKFAAGELDDIEAAAKRTDESLDETLNRVVERSFGLTHAESAPQIRYERRLIPGMRTLEHLLQALSDARDLKAKLLFGRSRAELALDKMVFQYSGFILEDDDTDGLAEVARVQTDFFQPEDRGTLLGDTTGRPPADYHASVARVRELWRRLQLEGFKAHLIDSQDLKELVHELELFRHSSIALYEQRCAQLIAYRRDILQAIGLDPRPVRPAAFP